MIIGIKKVILEFMLIGKSVNYYSILIKKIALKKP